MSATSSELTFIFGPNKTFFFDSPRSWKFHNIPPTLRQLFNSSMSPGWRIAQPFCLALGPQINSPEPIWYVSCRVLSGEEKIFYSQTYFDFNYPDLAAWTKRIPNAPRACFVTFGPGLSYFGCAQGHGSVWAGVSSELTDKVQKAYDTPSSAALGVNSAWFVMWPDGYFAWKFYGAYEGLDKELKGAEPRSVAYVAISPYNKEHYFIAYKDRTVKYNFAGCPEWIPQIQEVFNEWQAEILQRQGMQPPPSIPPVPAIPPQWNQYLPTAGQPTYVAAHYANAVPPPPQHSPYNPHAVPPPQQFAVELPGTMLEPPRPPMSARPASIMTSASKRSFFSRKRSKVALSPVPSPAHATSTEGSQTCNVM